MDGENEAYRQEDARGFIRLHALPLRVCDNLAALPWQWNHRRMKGSAQSTGSPIGSSIGSSGKNHATSAAGRKRKLAYSNATR